MLLRLFILCVLACPAFAAELRVCTDNRNVPPLVYVNGMGAAQYMLPAIAANLGLPLSISYHPQPRCLLELRNGRFDALLVTAPNPATLATIDFPLTDDKQFDESRAYLVMSAVAFHMKSSRAQWDGKNFSHLNKPVLYETGVPAVNVFMATIDVPSKASARTPVHMIQMIRLGRADMGIGLAPAVRYAMKTADPDGEFEILEPPLFEASLYLGISKAFHAANPKLAERLWSGIRQFKSSPQWLEVEEQVLNNQLAPTPELLKANQPREQSE